MTSEFIKRIFTSAILLLFIFFILINLNEDYFKYFLIFAGIFCFGEWVLTNVVFLKKNDSSFKSYFILLFGFIYFLLIFPSSAFYLRFEIGLHFFILILLICIFSDVGGYVFGKTIGGKKLTKISPNKTISGSIGSFIFSIFPIIFIYLFNFETSLLKLNFTNILFSLFVSLICQLGDLFFSYFKRLNNKKNYSNLFPGHGGLLDRIDGLIIVIPVIYLIKIFEII